MQVFAPSTAIWFLINFQTCHQVLNFSEKLLINQSFIIQKIPMLFFLVILHWRVKGKGDLYSRWKHVHACFSAYIWQERSSPTFCNCFSQQIPINPNTQICSMLGGYVCGNFIKEQYRTLPSILSCHQYPFAWLLCLDLALECNILGMFSRTGLSPIPRNNTVRY